jgi:hypothetical protein
MKRSKDKIVCHGYHPWQLTLAHFLFAYAVTALSAHIIIAKGSWNLKRIRNLYQLTIVYQDSN